MNILELWPTETIDQTPTHDVCTDMIMLRWESFKGFCQREKKKGFVDYGTSFAISRGQEMLRIMFFRVIEEFVEAQESDAVEHILEELIDAYNYLLAARLIEYGDMTKQSASYHANVMMRAWVRSRSELYSQHRMPSMSQLAQVSRTLGNVGDFLRNRAWMENAQDLYFNGYQVLDQAIETVSTLIMEHFESWEEFWRYYKAKDNVLQFRLRSNY